MGTSRATLAEQSSDADIERLPPTLRRALANARLSAQEWESLLHRLGVDCKPIGAESLQRMLIDAGHDPNSNEFSRDLIARRED